MGVVVAILYYACRHSNLHGIVMLILESRVWILWQNLGHMSVALLQRQLRKWIAASISIMERRA